MMMVTRTQVYPLPATAIQPRAVQSMSHIVFNSLRRNVVALTGGVVILFFILLAILGPYITPYDPLAIDLSKSLQGPTLAHPFGNDGVGRDIFSRVIAGTRTSLLIAVVGVAIALFTGVIVGQLAGYYGGLIDNVAMRVIDVMLAFPSLLLAIVILSMLGPGLHSTMIAIGISSIPQFTRLARGSTLQEKARDYVEAAHTIGAGDLRILAVHILPNIIAPIIVQATLTMSTMILTAAGLSFIGLGVQPPTPEWGVMMSQGRSYLQEAPHGIMFPGLAVISVVLGFNLFGDGLRDALDPKLRK